MKPKNALIVISSLLLLLLPVDAKPEVVVEKAATMKRVEEKITAMGKMYGPNKVLVVFDVDNTLLVMPHDLGSVAWWHWQVSLLRKGVRSRHLVARTIGELIRIQYAIFSIADMNAAEERIPAMIKNFSEQGYGIMALTARGPEVQGSTLRELHDAGIQLGNSPLCGQILCGGGGIVPDHKVFAAAKKLFGLMQLRNFQFADWNMPIGYSGGVLSVSGQHKGALLMLLVHSADANRYGAIVFVDDDAKNVEHVRRAYEASDVEVTAIHYTRFQADVRAFNKDRHRQEEATEAWEKFRVTLCSVFNKFC